MLRTSISDSKSTRLAAVAAALAGVLVAAPGAIAQNTLVGRAVFPAESYAAGPTSGRLLGTGPVNGIPVPFKDLQPVQGFSAIADNHDGRYWVMSDNGFGSIENSADYHLRVYLIAPDFETASGGSGTIAVDAWIELSDPDRRIPFAITNAFNKTRILTGADFDIESMQVAPDGTLWFGDEFGPFLLHTDAAGKVLEAPFPLPDFDFGGEIRSPQSPKNEEASAIRIMNAMRRDAEVKGSRKAAVGQGPVFSPWFVMLQDNDPATFVDNRLNPPAGSGLVPASSEIFNVASMKSAGYPVVVWTVNDPVQMASLMKLGVNGIISDDPELLLQAVRDYDANGDGTPGDFLTPAGLIDIAKFDAQGHRGGRNLRPENTLPAMEVALDNLMTTLELDCGVTKDEIPVLDHDPLIQSEKARRADGLPYDPSNEVLVKDLTLAEIQATFIADKLLPGRPKQTNNLALSPVAVDYAAANGLIHPYVMPSLSQVFDFVKYYEAWYATGPGKNHPDANLRRRTAERVRFNVETKVNPRAEFAARTFAPKKFARAVGNVIRLWKREKRADIQSFDFRTLRVIHADFKDIRTVCLFGDFPIFDDPTIPGSDDGTNLQDEYGANTPWLAELRWPYRVTQLDHPFRAARSGGFEGMALTSDGTRLLPLLEAPLVNGKPATLLIHEFDLATKSYTGVRYEYPLDPKGTNIGDFIMYDADRGLVIERDGSQGNLGGYKRVFDIQLVGNGLPVVKTDLVDLMSIADPDLISLPGDPGDVGLGNPFAMPFVTIEDILILDPTTIGIINDNNFPFSIGRHVGSSSPDDSEFILIQLPKPLGS